MPIDQVNDPLEALPCEPLAEMEIGDVNDPVAIKGGMELGHWHSHGHYLKIAGVESSITMTL